MTFIQQVTEQLSKMSEEEKDRWILSQAKLLKESERQGFYMSLSGEKKISYMPCMGEIEEFCRKVEAGKIYLEYETHYYEFDDDGRYMDDWKIWHNDPFGAMPFLDSVFMGCHDLLVLEEYRMAADILDRVCRLEFVVVEAPDSEDFEGDSPFTLEDADEERLLSRELAEIGMDWVRAVICRTDEEDARGLAREVVELLEDSVCKKIHPHMLLEDTLLAGKLPKDLFVHMANVLNAEVQDAEKIFREKFSEIRYSYEKIKSEMDIIRKKEIALNIRLKCMKEELYQQEPMSFAFSWELLGELFELLKHEHVVREQWEIDEVKEICGSLLKRDDLGKEDWELRKKVLSDIVSHRYYDGYGCRELMSELSEKLCVKKEEVLAFADMLDKSGDYKEKAAYLYHQYGKEDKYISYLETHLGKASKPYVDLVDGYRKQGNFDGARKIARQGLEQCRDNLTELFIYLLVDARKNGEIDDYKKLYASAKRRKGADIAKIDKALNGEV